jgi:hypothetical protein
MMNFMEALRWDLLGVGFQMALCAGILFGWMRRRMKRRAAAPAEPDTVSPVFAQEVFLQTLRQQAEQALRNILAAVEAERDRLQHALTAAAESSRFAEPKTGGPTDAPAAFRWGDSEPDGIGPSRYVGLEALAQQGLTARQIADRTSLPAGEIELALKLRDGTHPTHSIEAIRQ